MNEKAVQPQFYKDLNYNQLRDIVPLRKREWDGMIISALDDKKPYMYENYYDMIYSFDKGRYPTSRDEAIFYKPELVPEVEVEKGQILILNFEGADGAITWTEEAQGLTLTNSGDFILDTSSLKYGSSSVMGYEGATGYLVYTLPVGITGDFTIHGWMSITGLSDWITNELGYADFFWLRTTPDSTPEVELYLYTDSGELLFGVTGTADDPSADGLFSEGAFQHIAFIASGDNRYLAVGGNIIKTWTSPSVYNSSWVLGDFEVTFSGLGADIRWDAIEVLNYAKWKSDFTPPKHPPVKGIITV